MLKKTTSLYSFRLLKSISLSKKVMYRSEKNKMAYLMMLVYQVNFLYKTLTIYVVYHI